MGIKDRIMAMLVVDANTKAINDLLDQQAETFSSKLRRCAGCFGLFSEMSNGLCSECHVRYSEEFEKCAMCGETKMWFEVSHGVCKDCRGADMLVSGSSYIVDKQFFSDTRKMLRCQSCNSRFYLSQQPTGNLICCASCGSPHVELV